MHIIFFLLHYGFIYLYTSFFASSYDILSSMVIHLVEEFSVVTERRWCSAMEDRPYIFHSRQEILKIIHGTRSAFIKRYPIDMIEI